MQKYHWWHVEVLVAAYTSINESSLSAVLMCHLGLLSAFERGECGVWSLEHRRLVVWNKKRNEARGLHQVVNVRVFAYIRVRVLENGVQHVAR